MRRGRGEEREERAGELRGGELGGGCGGGGGDGCAGGEPVEWWCLVDAVPEIELRLS